MLEKIFLVFMIVLAVISINAVKLRRAVIYLAIFSLVSSFVFLLYSAPDVAIAEAIMAAALTTVLYLVAIKKHKTMTIYYIKDEDEKRDTYQIGGRKPQILKDIEDFFIKKELEPQIISTSNDPEMILEKGAFDFLVHSKKNKVYVYGHEKDVHLEALEELFEGKQDGGLEIVIVRYKEGGDMHA